jgi:hypothetical protein
MVTNCINPGCRRPFRYSSEGKLFLLEPSRHGPAEMLQENDASQSMECFWLCASCCTTLTLNMQGGKPAVVPRSRGELKPSLIA